MSKATRETDFSSVVTQVSKSEETSPVVLPGHAPTNNRSTRRRRLFSIFLCCLNLPRKNRAKNALYSSSDDASTNQESQEKFLLPILRPQERAKICLVIDLDETLVHSSFKPVANADFIVPVEIDGQVHQVYVTKRPHVDEFLRRVGNLFECVLFTASLSKYADPVADLLDPNKVFQARLFRESCTLYNGNYIKDLSRLGRDLRRIIIIDNSPVSYIFHQDNAVPVTSWFDDMNDHELESLIPIFERLATVDDVIPALKEIHRRRLLM